ncbi:MAG: glycogen debranching enzyme N-terminal domain-containing protein, partial [Lachnospiraceae bacterium]|nr:glycogen debranching enzyme N-terminal domain-containing protein [Lachnospiraceae bacterium]
MSRKYVIGRNAFRTLKEGLEREWILTNGIGGLSNSTIIGASNRIHNGYLTVALNPPADRYTVLSNVWEVIHVGGKVYDLAAQLYVGYEKNGYAYLNEFSLDILPTFTYQVEDILMRKTIALKYGHNKAVVCYEVENGM